MSDEIKSLVERVKVGERLREAERLDALDALDNGDYTTAELAQLLGVSERQIRRDRAKLRRRYQQALRDMAIAGEIYREYRATLERIDKAIADGDHKRVRSLAARWGVCAEFGKFVISYQVDELARLVEQLKQRMRGALCVHKLSD